MSNNFIDFSKPFIKAAKNVFETMVYTQLETGKPFVKDRNKSSGDVSAVLGLSGELTQGEKICDYRAMLILSWPYSTYVKVAGAMLMDPTLKEYSDEIGDVGAEICNMIMGNAKRELKDMGYSSNMAIPSMIEGKAHKIKYPNNTTVIVIPIRCAHGEMFIELCYIEC